MNHEPHAPLHAPGRRGPGQRPYRRAVLAAMVTAVLGATSLLAVPAANAVVPAFPDNLVVFPDRDMITIEGYQDRAGQTALVEIRRPGAGVVGSAQAVVSGGDMALEVNHPGGVCWGAGTGLKVTPDIVPGDTVSVTFGGVESGTTLVQDAYVTAGSVRSGNTVTVTGHVGAGVKRDQIEQRVIDPALKGTAVGRRDVRAVGGDQAVENGYRSQLRFDVDGPGTFRATYLFDDAQAAALVASAGGARAMAWQEQDADGNRQGLTIAEFGEGGGPGMGGCPNGPLQSGPAGRTNVSAAPPDLKVNWVPAQALAGTPPITGYRVSAVARTMTGNEQVESGVRINGSKAASTTIRGLAADEEYDVYVVSVSDVGETFPAVHAFTQTDTVAPTVKASPAGGSFTTAQDVTLTADEPGSDIYYTLDGGDPISGGMSAPSSLLYDGPIRIAGTSTLTFAALDPSGNVSANGTASFTITDEPLHAAPAALPTPTVGAGFAEVTWSVPDAGGPGLTIDGYTVQAYTVDGEPAGAAKQVPGNVTSVVYDGLTADTAYRFGVRAVNRNGTGPESPRSAPVTIQGGLVADAGPDRTVTRGTTATAVTLDGTRSTSTGVTYRWEQVLTGPNDPDRVTLNGTTTATPDFSLPLFRSPMTNNALTFRLTVTAGGATKTDDVRVTPVPDRVTTGIAQWKSGDLRIEGTSSVVGGVITVRVGGPTGRVLGTATVTAAAAPATGGVYALRLRNAAAGTTSPGSVWVESTVGGTAGPTTVTTR